MLDYLNMSLLEKEFLEKIEKHKGVIFKISKMYMDHLDDQKDLFQEITFQVWKAYPTFEGKSQFSTWLYKVALNTAIVFLKSEKKRNFIKNDEVENFKIVADDYDDDQEKKLATMYKSHSTIE